MNPLKKYLLSSVFRKPEAGGEAPPPPPPDEGDDAAVREAFEFDPSTFFTPQAKEGPDGGEGGAPDKPPSSGEPGEKDPAGKAAPSGSPPPIPEPDPAKAAGEDDPLASIRDAVKSFLSKKPEEPKAQPESPAAPPKAPEAPKEEAVAYNFELPSEIVDALGHEEPAVRRKAINGIVNGLANKLAKDFGSAMATMAQHVQTETVKAVLAQVDGKSQQQRVRDDFYSSNPDIKELVDNLPMLDNVVWQVAHAVADHTGQKGWTKELRDQTAATLRLQLRLPPPTQGAAPAAAAPGGKPPRKQQFNPGGGGNSGQRQGGAADGNEFLQVLGAGS